MEGYLQSCTTSLANRAFKVTKIVPEGIPPEVNPDNVRTVALV